MHKFLIKNEAPEQANYVDELNRQYQLHDVDCSGPNADTLSLRFEAGTLKLFDSNMPKASGVFVDFASDAMTYRRLHGGGTKEFIAKAVGVKKGTSLSVVDATAGLGRDACLLAHLGCNVIMIERSPVVAALLADGLNRAYHHPDINEWTRESLSLRHGIAIDIMSSWCEPKPDVVYLDPMFPHRKKSAAVKKEMQLFQHLLGPDMDADMMLLPAIQLASKRVVVKRPSTAPYLDGKKPDSQIVSKKHRYDVYFAHGAINR